MAHAARATAEASRKASLAAANASLVAVGSPSTPESGEVFSYDSSEERTEDSVRKDNIEKSSGTNDDSPSPVEESEKVRMDILWDGLDEARSVDSHVLLWLKFRPPCYSDRQRVSG